MSKERPQYKPGTRADVLKSKTIHDAELLKGGAIYKINEDTGNVELILSDYQKKREIEEAEYFEDTKDKRAAENQRWKVAIDTNKKYNVEKPYITTDYSEDTSSFSRSLLYDKLSNLTHEQFTNFVKNVQTSDIFITQSRVENGNFEVLELYMKPPIGLSYPTEDPDEPSGLARCVVDKRGELVGIEGFDGYGLVNDLISHTDSLFDCVEKIVIDDKESKTNGYKGPPRYIRWHLKKKNLSPTST